MSFSEKFKCFLYGHYPGILFATFRYLSQLFLGLFATFYGGGFCFFLFF